MARDVRCLGVQLKLVSSTGTNASISGEGGLSVAPLVLAVSTAAGTPASYAAGLMARDNEGSVEWRRLPDTPLVLDVESGLWAQGPKGIMKITEDGIQLAAEARTALSGLGRTTPIFADVFVDIEDDGIPETILSNGRSLRIVSTDGTERGQISIRGQGELSTRVMGGIKVVAASVSPSWWEDDFNGDGFNDCLILDHLEDEEDIDRIDVFNRYGTKIYELNDYVDQWCGDNQDGEIMPVGTYFYIIYFNSSKEPITSWIYLNY